MDYFKQRRAWRKLKRDQIDVSTGQNNLYRELLDYANDEGKLDELFTLKNSALADLTGLSEAGLKKARNELVQLELIKYIPGKRNKQKPRYQIIQIYNKSWDTGWATRNDKSSSTSTVTSSSTGNPTRSSTGNPTRSSTGSSKVLTSTRDLNLTNTLNTNAESVSVPKTDPTGDFVTKVWPAYPKKGGFQFAQSAFVEAVTSGETTTDKVLAKIDEYKRFIALNQIQSGFVKGAKSWFEGHGWMDEYDLSAPQKRPESKGQPAQKETLPDWAQPGYEAPQEQSSSDDELEDSLAGLRKLRQERGI